MWVVIYTSYRRRSAYFLTRKEAKQFARGIVIRGTGSDPEIYFDPDIEVQSWEASIRDREKHGTSS